MIGALFQWFKPAPHIPRKSEAEIKRLYPRFRWQVFEATFLAYATFYLVRNNFSPVQKQIGEALHYDESMLGNILAGTAIAYGIGKFIMGYFADRSDARKYLAFGLMTTAAINFIFGSISNYWGHVFLWTLNGFVQGMGYGPCSRGLSHWYSAKERGTIFGFWNVSHNVGGGIAGYLAAKCAQHWGWPSAFYVPGAIAAIGAIYLLVRMRDTPQSEGLPAVEEYKNDWPPDEKEEHEKELTARELFLKYILPNRKLWILAFANVFVYIARYAMVDWGPYYLQKIKGASLGAGGFSTTVIELAGGAGMLTMGWVSDKFGGLRARVSVLAMIPLLFAFYGIIALPTSELWVYMTLFGVIGFCVYVPVMFSGVMSLDLTSKKAVGTAAGFVGLFGYIGRTIEGKGIGWLAKNYGWDAALWSILGCTLLGIILLAFLWNVKPRG
jgi:OPA family glycerol-3-phosphate transporter-like MFS transporter